LPPDLAAVVERCLAKDPRARFADAGEVAEALAACACAGTWRPARGELPQSTASTADGEDHAPTPPAAPSARAEPITGPTLTTPRRNSAGDPAS
jgi:serine/threonine-protein kinase